MQLARTRDAAGLTRDYVFNTQADDREDQRRQPDAA
jgi:hypothetical protein